MERDSLERKDQKNTPFVEENRKKGTVILEDSSL